jgi:ribosome-associated protein
MPKAPSQVALSALSRKSNDQSRAAARAAARAEDAESLKTAELAGRAALEKKGDDVVLLDLRGVSGYADFLVVVSGNNERQLDAIADGVEKSLKENGHRLVGAEGGKGSRWNLLDFGDVVVHVFHEDERHHYDLEGLWADAPRTRFTDAPRTEAQPTA